MAGNGAPDLRETLMRGEGLVLAEGNELESEGLYPLAASQERVAEPSDVLTSLAVCAGANRCQAGSTVRPG
jgi:hypothetical protein